MQKMVLVSLLTISSAIAQNQEFRSLVGHIAPPFSASAAVEGKEKKISLSDYNENYKIVVFYPADFSFVCPTELRALQEKKAEFEKRKAVILAISVDQVYSHLAWLETPSDKGGIKGIMYPLLSDTSHAISRAYGVLTHEGYAQRALFILDKDNIVQAALINNGGIGRNMDEALRLLDALIESEESGGVCPASWHKGDESIQPTAEGKKEYFKKNKK